jgi:hypothetical protein
MDCSLRRHNAVYRNRKLPLFGINCPYTPLYFKNGGSMFFRNSLCFYQSALRRISQIRRWANNYPHHRYKHYFNKNRKLIITPLFNAVPLFSNALLPSLHELPYVLKKKKKFWAVQHCTACTASFISWSEVNRRPLNVSLSGPNMG